MSSYCPARHRASVQPRPAHPDQSIPDQLSSAPTTRGSTGVTAGGRGCLNLCIVLPPDEQLGKWAWCGTCFPDATVKTRGTAKSAVDDSAERTRTRSAISKMVEKDNESKKDNDRSWPVAPAVALSTQRNHEEQQRNGHPETTELPHPPTHPSRGCPGLGDIQQEDQPVRDRATAGLPRTTRPTA
jgi:hypothetical protein